MTKKTSFKAYEKSGAHEGFRVQTHFDKRGHLKEVGVEKDPDAAASTPAIAALIDHTLLKPESTAEQIEQLCAEAAQYHFGAVCVNACWVATAAQALQGTGVKVGATIGFPWGTSSTAAKVAETRQAIADEIESLNSPPLLYVQTSPPEGTVVPAGPRAVNIRGLAPPGAKVTIDGKPVSPVRPGGYFCQAHFLGDKQPQVTIAVEHEGRKRSAVRTFKLAD